MVYSDESTRCCKYHLSLPTLDDVVMEFPFPFPFPSHHITAHQYHISRGEVARNVDDDRMGYVANSILST